MNSFNRRTAIRIALVSILLASIASPMAWFVAQENAEESIVALAMDESKHLLAHHDSVMLSGPEAQEHAEMAVQSISNALFDISEIYDRQGNKLAEALTADGHNVEALLPKHLAPKYSQPFYEKLSAPDGRWILRVFVPLHGETDDPQAPITGYFEGVRVVPDWQRKQVSADALAVVLMVCLASLLCGAALYPVILHLAADNQRKAMQSLIAGSFLHDVGKIGIPDAILLKPGKLDDALCSKRPYKEAMPFAQAMAILEKDTGSHFDPAVMQIFRQLAPALQQRLRDIGEEEVRRLLQERVRTYFGV